MADVMVKPLEAGDEPAPVQPEPQRPKRLPMAFAPHGPPPDLVPARMVSEALFCERALYLKWAQNEFVDNAFTVEGRLVHRRADAPGGSLPKPPDPRTNATRMEGSDDDAREGDEPPPYEARSLWLSSETLGMTAKLDIVEGDVAGRVTPVEYKRGATSDLPEGATLSVRAQLCVQVLLLREHGYRCDEAFVYYAASKQRVPIAIDEALIAITCAAALKAREITARASMPPPLVDSPKCVGCSLIGICLPDEVTMLRRLETDEGTLEERRHEQPGDDMTRDLEGPLASDPWGLAGTVEISDARLRRSVPARDDKLPVYVQEQGAKVGLQGDRLIARGRETHLEARLSNTSQLNLMGNVQISTQALRELLIRGIPVSLHSANGWYIGKAIGLESKNVDLRMAQHRAAADPERCLQLARGFVESKIKNSRTLLRRNHSAPDPTTLKQLDILAAQAINAPDLATLLGYEGVAARYYFGAFSGMLKGEAARTGTFAWEGRNRRPPKDPINAVLSFAYALLTRELSVVLGGVGLDPMLGFYHQPRFGRPALALDLMEEFRPLLADSTVLAALNNGVIRATDFIHSVGGVAIKPNARKDLILAYERRMDQLVTHPLFGYRISYRRVLEVQARLLSRVLLGEIQRYPPFRTR